MSPSRRVSERSEGEFRVGDRVRHAKFGDGLVLHVTGSGEATALTVSFSGDGIQRKLLARAAHLERVDAKGAS